MEVGDTGIEDSGNMVKAEGLGKDNLEQDTPKKTKTSFGFYKNDYVVQPFMSKTVEKNMMKYILGKVKYPPSYKLMPYVSK